MTFCSLGTKGSRIVTGDEKWIYFENSERKKLWVDLAAPSTSTARPNRFGWETMLCVWWDQRGVVDYIFDYIFEKMVNTKRRRFELFSAWKKVKIPKEKIQSHLLSWIYSITYEKTGLRHVGSTQLGSFTPCGLLTRLGSFRLSFVCIDVSRTSWAALWIVRRCEKMARWMVHSKRRRFLPA